MGHRYRPGIETAGERRCNLQNAIQRLLPDRARRDIEKIRRQIPYRYRGNYEHLRGINRERRNVQRLPLCAAARLYE